MDESIVDFDHPNDSARYVTSPSSNIETGRYAKRANTAAAANSKLRKSQDPRAQLLNYNLMMYNNQNLNITSGRSIRNGNNIMTIDATPSNPLIDLISIEN